jgi:hypothetical protein
MFRLPWSPAAFAFGDKFMPRLSQSHILGVVLFLILAISLYTSARKKLD